MRKSDLYESLKFIESFSSVNVLLLLVRVLVIFLFHFLCFLLSEFIYFLHLPFCQPLNMLACSTLHIVSVETRTTSMGILDPLQSATWTVQLIPQRSVEDPGETLFIAPDIEVGVNH